MDKSRQLVVLKNANEYRTRGFVFTQVEYKRLLASDPKKPAGLLDKDKLGFEITNFEIAYLEVMGYIFRVGGSGNLFKITDEGRKYLYQEGMPIENNKQMENNINHLDLQDLSKSDPRSEQKASKANDHIYDVAFSFAGEDRQYVRVVASMLVAKGIKVFYDEFEKMELWGKDLTIHFDKVYRKNSKFCLPFISEHYKNKIWTKHELRTAISKAIENENEYILPARFDDTQIEGIRPSIAFIDLRELTPEEFANIIYNKITQQSVEKKEGDSQLNSVISIGLGTSMRSDEKIIRNYLNLTITNTLASEYLYFEQPFLVLTKPKNPKENAIQMWSIANLLLYQFPLRMERGQRVTLSYEIDEESIQPFKGNPEGCEFYAVIYNTLGQKYESTKRAVEDIMKM